MSSKKDSRALRFYSDVLGLEHLHYGLWQAGEETSLANLKAAQALYQQAIIDLLPPPPARILDVGCGTGELSNFRKRLVTRGRSACKHELLSQKFQLRGES